MSEPDVTILHGICRWVLAVQPKSADEWLEIAAELRRAALLAYKQAEVPR